VTPNPSVAVFTSPRKIRNRGQPKERLHGDEILLTDG
jgi:hypothetical protein